jgi:hypothetical protein
MVLSNVAGNFHVNDKPTGAVLSARSVREAFWPRYYKYPLMGSSGVAGGRAVWLPIDDCRVSRIDRALSLSAILVAAARITSRALAA